MLAKLVIAAVVSLGLIGPAAEPVSAQGGALYLQVREAKLRSQPKHWAPGVAEAVFGEALEEIGRDGDWVRVQSAAGARGFLHQSAVTPKVIVLREGVSGAPIQGDLSNIVLAGKGFNRDVEAKFAGDNADLDYALLDRLEARTVAPEDLFRFMREGGLNAAPLG